MFQRTNTPVGIIRIVTDATVHYQRTKILRTVKRRIKQMTNMVYVANGYSGHWEIKYFLRQQYDFGLTVQ